VHHYPPDYGIRQCRGSPKRRKRRRKKRRKKRGKKRRK